MRRFLTTLMILLVVLVAGLSALVLLVNPNDFRDYMVKQVAARSGYQLQLDGPLRWHVWPPRVLLNFAFVIFAFLRRYGRRIIREIFPSATPQKSFFCVFISSAEIISKTFNLASKSRRRKWIPALT